MQLKVVSVDTVRVDLPYEGYHAIHMPRQHRNSSLHEVCRVEAEGGLVGYGESGVAARVGGPAKPSVSEADIGKVVGEGITAHLWDATLPAGLQMALLDLTGKALEVPAHQLLGEKIRDWCPLSWWCVDMPPEHWANEAKRAVAAGYTSMKLKVRPWFDIFAQIQAVCAVVPTYMTLDLDFNGLLVNAGNAIPVLRELEDFPNVSIFETPIPQTDTIGNRRIRQKVSRPIAMHYGTPPIMTALREDICNGFVVGGKLSQVRDAAAVLAAHNKPFWLQLTGTGITAAFALHLGAVLSHAQWPAITCHENFRDDLIREPIQISGGHMRVPEGPGLGVEVDEEALERYRVADDFEYEPPKEIYRISWPDGSCVSYADAVAYRRDFLAGLLPISLHGVEHTVLVDDGSLEFAQLRKQALARPVWTTS